MSARYDAATVPADAAAGLDLFAAAWLERWTDAGGSVHIERDGRMMVGYPDQPPGELQTESASAAAWRHASYTGGMRAMLDLLGHVPGGNAAVRQHLLEHGMTAIFGGAVL